MSDAERRRFHRVPFVAVASLHGEHEDSPVELIDLSLKGALFKILGERPLKTGARASLHITLSNDVFIEMDGRVVHRHGDVEGFECSELDLDSARHLVRLVELNLGDPDLMERELKTLLAQHA